MSAFAIFEAGELEIRRSGRTRTVHGRFNYGSTAIIRDRGRVRKERFEPRAFRFAIEDDSRQIDVLVGHSFDKPLASRKAGTLEIADGDDGVTFEARLPDDPPSWVVDAERAIAAGLMTGLSPGFTVPPASAVPDAERLEPEPGNPGVQIRVIREAVLREFSIVTAAAYVDAEVDLRAEHLARTGDRRRRVWL